MKKLLCLLIGISSVNWCHATDSEKSIPGYMGARNTLCLKVMPDIPLKNNILLPLTHPSFVLSLERATNMKNSLVLSAGMTNGVLEPASYNLFNNKLNNHLEGVSSMQGNLYYSNMFFSYSKSYYNSESGSIAPQGKYTRIGPTIGLVRIVKNDFTYRNNKDSLVELGPEVYKNIFVASFGIEFGSKRFIYKKLFVNKSIAFNIPFTFWRAKKNRTFTNAADYHMSNLDYYLHRVQTINVSLGIGIAF